MAQGSQHFSLCIKQVLTMVVIISFIGCQKESDLSMPYDGEDHISLYFSFMVHLEVTSVVIQRSQMEGRKDDSVDRSMVGKLI